MTSYVCAVPACSRWTVQAEYGTPVADPVTEVICLDHYRDLKVKRAEAAERAANAERARVHAAEMAAMPEMTCYGDAGHCPNFGAQYPGGVYCREHRPIESLPTFEATLILFPEKAAPAVAPSEPLLAPSEPLLAAVECPEDKLPGSVRSAVKKAVAGGWAHRVTLAIGPEPETIHSVVFTACKDGTRIGSRHEGDGTKTLGFKAAFASFNNRMPLAIGWREVTAILDGLDLMEKDRQEMKDAVFLLFDSGADIVEVTSHA